MFLGLGLGINGRRSGGGGGGVPAIPAFDGLDNLYALHGTQTLLTTYTGALVRIRRSTDDAEQDFSAAADGYLSAGEISTFIGGGTGFVTTVYDQTGNSRPAVMTTNANQPTIDLTTTKPTIKHVAASSQYMSVPTILAFAQNIGAVSLVAKRRYNSLATGVAVAVGTNTTTARMVMNATATVLQVGGRRLDADANDISQSFATDLDWHTEVGRYDYTNSNLYHRLDGLAEEDLAFQTSGLTSNTASASVSIGRGPAATLYADMNWAALAFVRDLLTDAEAVSIIEDLDIPTTTLVSKTTISTGAGTLASTASRVPHQRNNFYAEGRYWLFWGDYSGGGAGPFDLKYRSATTAAGLASASDTTLTTFPVADAQWGIVFDDVAGKIHVVKNIQSGVIFHDGLQYRRGTPASDGSIAWDAAFQTAIATGNFAGDFAMAVDSSGLFWIGYGDNGSGDPTKGNARAIKNSATDGTWATASGFPALIRAGVADDPFVILSPLASGAMHGTVYEWATDAVANSYTIDSAGTVVSNGALTSQSVEADAGTAAQVGRIESAAREGSAIVHTVYTRSGGAEIRYRRRDAAGVLATEILLASSKSEAIASSPRISFSGASGVIVTWTQGGSVQWVCRSTDDGLTFGTATAFNTTASIDGKYEHLMPAEYADPSGNVPLTYLDAANRLIWAVLPA